MALLILPFTLKAISTGGNYMNAQLTRIFRKVPAGYIGYVQELPGANTQGETLEETRANLEEAIELVLEAKCVLGFHQ